jgi:hypothetical protein
MKRFLALFIIIIILIFTINGCAMTAKPASSVAPPSSIATQSSTAANPNTTTTPLLSSPTASSSIFPNIAPSVAGSYSLDIEIVPFPTFPSQIQVYKVIKPEITSQYVTDTGTKLGLTEGVKQGNGLFYIQSGERSLIVYLASGGIEYSNNTFPKEKPVLPSDEEAITIATDALNKLGLLSPGLKGTNEGIGESAALGGTMGTWPISLTIGFKRNIDGLHFNGPGAKYEVRIGNKGEIRRILINPINYTPQKLASLKSVDQAFKEMKASKKYLAPMETKKVIIDSVTLDYWLESITKGQESISPVFDFSGQCFDGPGKQLKGSFTGYVEALQ